MSSFAAVTLSLDLVAALVIVAGVVVAIISRSPQESEPAAADEELFPDPEPDGPRSESERLAEEANRRRWVTEQLHDNPRALEASWDIWAQEDVERRRDARPY